jgi:hypothetical protein
MNKILMSGSFQKAAFKKLLCQIEVDIILITRVGFSSPEFLLCGPVLYNSMRVNSQKRRIRQHIQLDFCAEKCGSTSESGKRLHISRPETVGQKIWRQTFGCRRFVKLTSPNLVSPTASVLASTPFTKALKIRHLKSVLAVARSALFGCHATL